MKSYGIAAASYPPYLHDWKTTAKVSWMCSLSLAPLVIWSTYLYGRLALRVWLVSVLSAAVSEAIASGLLKRWTLGDGSAVLTGLLVATAMPPGAPWYLPACASAFAILIVKAAFGGLGANWMNPALAGVAFAYANWPSEMREFILPRVVAGVDGMSAATPMSFAKGLAGGLDVRVMDALRGSAFPVSGVDGALTRALNDSVFSGLGARLPDGYIDLAIGFKAGAIGESALLAVLLGSVVLLGLRIIKPTIPLAMIATFSVLVRVFGTGLPGESFLSGDVLFSLSGGGVLLAAFYMAPDPVSSPVRSTAGLAYGASIGALCFAFRRWGAYSEGAAYAILVMNVVTPFLEKSVAGLGWVRGRKLPS